MRTPNSWSDPGDPRVAELAKEALEIFGGAGHVGVNKRHKRRRHLGGSKVTGTTRPKRVVGTQKASAVLCTDLGEQQRFVAGIIDHKASEWSESPEESIELARAVANRNHNGEVLEPEGRVLKPWVGHAGINKPSSECSAGSSRGGTSEETFQEFLGHFAQAQEAKWSSSGPEP